MMAAMSAARLRFAILLAWLLLWALLTATAVQEYLRDNGQQLWKPLLWQLSSCATVTALFYLQRHYTRRDDTLVATPLRWLARQMVWLPVYWIVFTPVAFGIRHAVYRLLGERYTHEEWLEVLVYENVKLTMFFFVAAAVTFGVLSYLAMQQEKLRIARVDADLREMQLLRLAQQMQPHFLFNALNTISSLMHSDVERADAMLVQLADVLRATLDVGERHEAPLSTELQLLRGYAALMAERFADRVQIDWDIDAALLACPVPVLSLQPLLENIFKHTVERRRQPTRITIGARRDGNELVLTLDDDGGVLAPAIAGPGENSATGAHAAANAGSGSVPASGTASQTGGIGIRNLRARLAALYGERAAFTLTQRTPAGVRAQLRLPCAS